MPKKGSEAVQSESDKFEAKNETDMKAIQRRLEKDGYELVAYHRISENADEQSFQVDLKENEARYDSVAVINCSSSNERIILGKGLKQEVRQSRGIEDVQREILAQL